MEAFLMIVYRIVSIIILGWTLVDLVKLFPGYCVRDRVRYAAFIAVALLLIAIWAISSPEVGLLCIFISFMLPYMAV